MSYAISDALDPIREALADKPGRELVVRSEAGIVREFEVRRRVGPAQVVAVAAVDGFSVRLSFELGLSFTTAEKRFGSQWGQTSAEAAAALALEFVEFDGDDSLWTTFATYGRRPVLHELKAWPKFFRPLYRGEKAFEFRRDDRGFQVGDVLDLREWDPRPGALTGNPGAPGEYTGARLRRVVTYVLRDPEVGVPEGFAVLSLGPMP